MADAVSMFNFVEGFAFHVYEFHELTLVSRFHVYEFDGWRLLSLSKYAVSEFGLKGFWLADYQTGLLLNS